MENVRIQDVVARLAGVDLKSTVRVLRALSIAADSTDHRELSEAVESLLSQSTDNGGRIMALQAKPCRAAVEASEKVNKKVLKKVGIKHLESLRGLDGCPYAAARQIDDIL